MKKVLIIILALVLVLSVAACGKSSSKSGDGSGKSSNSSSASSESSSKSSSKGSDKTLDDSSIKMLVESALLKEIKSTYLAADPNSTRYNINKTEKNGDKTIVYGTLTMYDKYGKPTSGHLDGSGSISRSFEVTIKDGKATDCTIK